MNDWLSVVAAIAITGLVYKGLGIMCMVPW